MASWRFAFDDYRAQAFARAVDSGGKPGGTTADDGKIVEVGLGVCAKPDFIRNSGQRRLRKARPVGKQNQWKFLGLRPQGINQVAHFGVGLSQLHVNPLIGHLIAREEFAQLIGAV